jgi:hypothetical protein
LHNDFAESLVTRGLSPLPLCVLDGEQFTILRNIQAFFPAVFQEY